MTKLTKEKLENGQPPSKYFSMTSIRTCEIYEWVALFFLFHEFTYQWVYVTYMFAYVHLWAYSSVYRFVVIYHWGQKLCLIHLDFSTADKWISFGCIATMWVYLCISGEVFSWASVTCVSIWMGEEGTTRARRFGRGGQAGARKQETAGNRCDCLSGAHPVLCGLSKSGSMFSLPPGTF